MMHPTPQERIDTARAYVAASNAHDLEAIAPLLADGCRYESSGVGAHVGKPAILSMMKQFFESHRDVQWDVPAYEVDDEGRAAFRFTMSLDGDLRKGIEKISFAEDGLITLIEVRR